jgi:hypothetical protein
MLQHIILHLARSPEFPEGSLDRGYKIVAPIDATGHLDPKEWRKVRTQCRVTRFSPCEGERHGMLHHGAGGAKGSTWRIDYDDDQARRYGEKGVNFETHRFVEDEYLTLREMDGHLNVFKIAHMRPVQQAVKETVPA